MSPGKVEGVPPITGLEGGIEDRPEALPIRSGVGSSSSKSNVSTTADLESNPSLPTLNGGIDQTGSEQDEKKEKVVNEKEEVVTEESMKKLKWTPFDPFNRKPAPPPPDSMDDAPILPLATANFLSIITFWWIQPLLVLGAKRELAATDLPRMDSTREASLLADQFLEAFDRRKEGVEKWNQALEDGSYRPGTLERLRWKVWYRLSGFGSVDGKREIGSALALWDVFSHQFGTAGVFKVVGDLAQVTSPLVTRQIILYVSQSHSAARGVDGISMPSIGKGVGLALGLFGMQLLYSVCTAQTFSRGGQVGVLARGALIAATYRKSMVLSGRARVQLSNSKLVSLISADISRVDFCASFFHFSYSAVLQLLEVIVILLCTIGVSALAGVAVVALALPLQTYAVRKLFQGRQESMVFTEARVRSISELLFGIKVVKLFNWEGPTLERVHELRRRELRGIRKLLIIRAANLAIAMSIPTLASVVVFAVYAALGHTQNPAEIWTSLSLLNLLRMPLMLLPNSLSTITDAASALKRLTPVFLAETVAEPYKINEDAKLAISVREADFEWESSGPPRKDESSKKPKRRAGGPASKKALDAATETAEPPSRLSNISLQVPRGQLLCVVGPVGSGKSSLLQGLLGEMRKTKGEVTFGGSVSYCAQSSWALSKSIRDNILFGRPFDEERYWECVRAACLLSDFDMLPSGDMTEIGERGVLLSGGQRQRVSIARTLYFNADTVLLDDPLSAVDAHVGAYIFENVIQGMLKDKTVILVTHALHVLPHADRIIVMENGSIAEEGTYNELMSANSTFARLAREFGSGDSKEKDEDDVEKKLDEIKTVTTEVKAEAQGQGAEAKFVSGKALMKVEERATGGVSGQTYKEFIKAANGTITVPLLILSLFLMGGAQVMSNLELVWWQEQKFGVRSQAFYSGLYAALGVTVALFTFAMGVMSVILGIEASTSLHRNALVRVARAPLSFYDTTPIGRMLNRFTKDTDNLDGRLNDSLRMTLATFAQIAASTVQIAIVFPYFLIPVAVIFIGYFMLSDFYRQSAREIKRHDNILRSALYAWFSESLQGMSTIRAFGESGRFIHGLEALIDLENRPYFLTVINQRWLSIRLDFLGAILTIIVCIIAIIERTKISPSKIGLALAVILAVQQALSMVIRQSAEVENNLASVERLVYYQNELEQEAEADIPETTPEPSWPDRGQVRFDNVVMSYRPDLPPVLHEISFCVEPGEKIGIIGRTGSGKSSIMMTLFRICELSAGTISIDGVDISKLGLDQLRSKISIIPQESVLFAGTLRSNLDPFGMYEDRILWDALKRAWLVDRESTFDQPGTSSRFNLETVIEDDGSNMSIGEKALVSLARALVRDSRVIVADESTASLDFELDSKIQETIRTEFKDKTLLVIAHRIATIIGYSRVLVLDKGKVVAFDTPEALFNAGGIFQSLCIQSGISLDDIQTSQRRQ